MAIYHTIVTLKGGPLNVLQSNLASGTVHWILHHRHYNLSYIISRVWDVRRLKRGQSACGFFQTCVI